MEFEEKDWEPFKKCSIPTNEVRMKIYKVYLYKAPDCIRGWLEYIKPCRPDHATVAVEVSADTGPKAKNRAVTLANKGFDGLKIVRVNYEDELWGLNNFLDLKEIVERAIKKQKGGE